MHCAAGPGDCIDAILTLQSIFLQNSEAQVNFDIGLGMFSRIL